MTIDLQINIWMPEQQLSVRSRFWPIPLKKFDKQNVDETENAFLFH
jgi:hypothetical protein